MARQEAGLRTPREWLAAIPWRHVGIALYIGLNLAVLPFTIAFGPQVPDWRTFTLLPEQLADGSLYTSGALQPVFAWSPVMAWIMAGVSVVGYWPWVAAHVAAVGVLALRLPLVALLVACSWAFWIDAAGGNTMTFVVVAGALALRGGRTAGLLYIALSLLMPRPVQLPLLVWLLWHDRSMIKPMIIMFVVHGALVLGSGYAAEWITATASYGVTTQVSLGPTRYFGLAWLAVGIPLGGWLTWRGHVGWAGLAITPYLLAQYLLMPVIEIGIKRREASGVPRC